MWHILILVCLFQSNVALLQIQEDSTTTVSPGYEKSELQISNGNGDTTYVVTAFYDQAKEPEWKVEPVTNSVLKFDKYTNGFPSGDPLWFSLDFWENHFPSSTSKRADRAPMISDKKEWDRIKDAIYPNTRFFSFDDVWKGIKAAIANTG